MNPTPQALPLLLVLSCGWCSPAVPPAGGLLQALTGWQEGLQEAVGRRLHTWLKVRPEASPASSPSQARSRTPLPETSRRGGGRDQAPVQGARGLVLGVARPEEGLGRRGGARLGSSREEGRRQAVSLPYPLTPPLLSLQDLLQDTEASTGRTEYREATEDNTGRTEYREATEDSGGRTARVLTPYTYRVITSTVQARPTQARGQIQKARGQTPGARGQTKVARGQTPVTRGQTQVARGQTQVARGQTPGTIQPYRGPTSTPQLSRAPLLSKYSNQEQPKLPRPSPSPPQLRSIPSAVHSAALPPSQRDVRALPYSSPKQQLHMDFKDCKCKFGKNQQISV